MLMDYMAGAVPTAGRRVICQFDILKCEMMQGHARRSSRAKALASFGRGAREAVWHQLGRDLE